MRFYLNWIIFVRTHWNLMKLEPPRWELSLPIPNFRDATVWMGAGMEHKRKCYRSWQKVAKCLKDEQEREKGHENEQKDAGGVYSRFYLPNTQSILRVKHYWKATIKPPASKTAPASFSLSLSSFPLLSLFSLLPSCIYKEESKRGKKHEEPKRYLVICSPSRIKNCATLYCSHHEGRCGEGKCIYM